MITIIAIIAITTTSSQLASEGFGCFFLQDGEVWHERKHALMLRDVCRSTPVRHSTIAPLKPCRDAADKGAVWREVASSTAAADLYLFSILIPHLQMAHNILAPLNSDWKIDSLQPANRVGLFRHVACSAAR